MDITQLRKEIARIEGRTERFNPVSQPIEQKWSFGVREIDDALPGGCLGAGELHDFIPEHKVNIPAAAAFLMRLLGRLPRPGPIVWCQAPFTVREHGRPYAPGLLQGGMAPRRFVFVSLPHQREMGFALEEALTLTRVAAVLGEGPPLAFTETRRLSLVAAESGVPCLFLNCEADAASSVARTRWRIGPLPGPPDRLDPKRPGRPAWRLELTRARGGKPGSWEITWNDETRSFRALSEVRHRSLPEAGSGEAALQRASDRWRRRTG